MLDYYEAELRLLRQEALIFAKNHPDIAGRLGLHFARDQDPQAERLLEAVAYLSADLKRELDAQSNAHALLRANCPSWSRDYPSCFIGRMECARTGLGTTHVLSNSKLSAQNLKMPLKFSNPIDCHYWPITLANITLQHHDAEKSSIILELKLNHQAAAQSLLQSKLRLYVNGTSSKAYDLYRVLLQLTEGVRVYQSTSDGSVYHAGRLPRGAHLSLQDCLSPADDADKHPIDLWFDYFNFREKFLFIDLEDLDFSMLDPRHPTFFLEIHMRGMPHEITLDADALLVNALVLMNVYTRACEPLRVHPGRMTYPLVIDLLDDDHNIYALANIEAIDDTGLVRKLTEYSESNTEDASSIRYSLKQKFLSKFASHPYLVLHQYTAPVRYRLSIHAWVHDGMKPKQQLYRGLKLGNLSFGNAQLAVEVLSLPTVPNRAKDTVQLKLYAHQAQQLHYEDYTTLASFHRLFAALAHRGMGGLDYIRALRALKVHRSNVISQGVSKACLNYEFALARSHFINLGEIFLFGQVMYSFLYSIMPINQALMLEFTDEHAQFMFEWPHVPRVIARRE